MRSLCDATKLLRSCRNHHFDDDNYRTGDFGIGSRLAAIDDERSHDGLLRIPISLANAAVTRGTIVAESPSDALRGTQEFEQSGRRISRRRNPPFSQTPGLLSCTACPIIVACTTVRIPDFIAMSVRDCFRSIGAPILKRTTTSASGDDSAVAFGGLRLRLIRPSFT